MAKVKHSIIETFLSTPTDEMVEKKNPHLLAKLSGKFYIDGTLTEQAKTDTITIITENWNYNNVNMGMDTFSLNKIKEFITTQKSTRKQQLNRCQQKHTTLLLH
jgi:hypothetical protein